MICILISEAAYAAIGESGSVEERRDDGAARDGQAPKGMVVVWVLRPVVEALNAMRQPHEGLSEVIVRYAEAHR
jgi:hypothetical protein